MVTNFLAMLFAIILQAAPPPPMDVQSLVEAVDRTYGRMENLTATFEQNLLGVSNQRHTERGLLTLTKDRKFRLEYEIPEVKVYVYDGKKLTSYVQGARQTVIRKNVKANDEELPVIFLLGRPGLSKEFGRKERLDGKVMFPGDVLVRLIPNRKDQPPILMEVDPKTYWIRRLVVGDANSRQEEYVFSDMKPNQKLDAQIFEFKSPAGVEEIVRDR